MTCAPASNTVCPCGEPTFPVGICNPPNLPAIDYRVGDYLAFRHRLLQQLPGETELTVWRPGAQGDLGVQMVEWAAYLSDILTFYNERIANEAYLRTAMLPESVSHLVQILGYRPRPALGATGRVAALLTPSAKPPIALPKGLQIQSKPGPGQPPQVFELDAATTVTTPDVISANVIPVNQPLSTDGATVWLQGKVTTLKAGDRLLLIDRQALTAQTLGGYAWIGVTATKPGTDPLGAAITAISVSVLGGSLASDAQAKDYVLLRSQQSSPPWGYATTTTIISQPSGSQAVIAMASVARDLTPGSLMLIDAPASTGLTPTPVIVQSYSEAVWYANCGSGADAGTPPASPTPPMTMPSGQVTTATGLPGTGWDSQRAQVTARWGWTPVGQLAPMLTADDLAFTSSADLLSPAGAVAFPSAATDVLLQDGAGKAIAGTTSSQGADVAIAISPATTLPDGGLASPVDVMFDLLPLSRGKTVPSEILGSGNPMVPGQDFTLKNAPVTYFADTASVSGDGFTSTVKVSVDGVQWAEVQSFYGQAPNAQVFVLREDDQGQTHVTFGDGVDGSRLPTGTGNVVATYRYGAGAAAPAADTLVTVLTPQPGLKGVRNPVPPIGGADADDPHRLRQLAPQSVLAFNRAVSLDDYAAIALTAGGVTQAVAQYAFDARAQRPMVVLWVAGDDGAKDAASAKLAGLAMPGQKWVIRQAAPVEVMLGLTYVYDPRYDPAAVEKALTTALLDPDIGMFAPAAVGIGQVFYDSQIEAVCLAVAGVVAVHDLTLRSRFAFKVAKVSFGGGAGSYLRFGRRKAGGCTGQRHDPGAGQYFSLPPDGDHLTLHPMAATP